MNENVNNELRVRDVNHLNDLHAINGLSKNDDLLNVNNINVRENESLNEMPENLNVYVSVAHNVGMWANDNAGEREMRGMQNEYERENECDASGSARRTPANRSAGELKCKPEVSRCRAHLQLCRR